MITDVAFILLVGVRGKVSQFSVRAYSSEMVNQNLIHLMLWNGMYNHSN